MCPTITSSRRSRSPRGPLPPQRVVLAFFDAELRATHGARALVSCRPSGIDSAEDCRVPALFLPGRVVGEQSWIVVAPAPPRAIGLHFVEGVREGVAVRPDHPSQLDVRRCPPNVGERRPEGLEHLDIARADDLPRRLPDAIGVTGKQSTERVDHPTRIRGPSTSLCVEKYQGPPGEPATVSDQRHNGCMSRPRVPVTRLRRESARDRSGARA